MIGLRRWALLLSAIVLPPIFAAGCGKTAKSGPTSSSSQDPLGHPMGSTASSSTTWFEDRAAAAGIDFKLGHGGKTPLKVLETMGAGCAIIDYDGDGRDDIFLVGQANLGNKGKCALYHNNGDGSFTDVTSGSGLEAPGLYMGCAVADLDNDGRPDILVSGYGVMRLYKNLGGGKFADVTAGSGLEAKSATSWASSIAMADYDKDGLVDIYVGRYVVFNSQTLQFCDYGKYKSSCGPMFYDAQLGSLYHNKGNFKFEDVTVKCGLDSQHGKCLGAAWADVNNDGWPDLYIGNDEMPGDLFINHQGKRFTNDALAAGVALSSDGKFQGAMGIDFGDYNNDGRMDMIVSTFQFESSSLYLNSKDGVFQNQALTMGLEQPTRPMVGFGTKFVDVNNDGWLDIAVANGHIHDNQDLIDKFSHYRQPLQLFMSDGGKSYTDRAAEAGPGFSTPCVGRGLAVGDFNNDGLQDILVSDLEGQTRLLINRIPQHGNWLRVTLQGTKSNRMGIGAKVTVMAGQQKWTSECTTGGSYLSASDPRVHFGLGAVTVVDRVEVTWPSGKKSVVTSPRVPGDIKIVEK